MAGLRFQHFRGRPFFSYAAPLRGLYFARGRERKLVIFMLEHLFPGADGLGWQRHHRPAGLQGGH